MPIGKYCCTGLRIAMTLVLCALLTACMEESPPPSITIEVPTSGPSFHTTASAIRIGGTVSHGSTPVVRNVFTGFSTEAYCCWWADVSLAPGDNAITATTQGTEGRTASASITIRRPSQPANLMINGDTQASTNTYWIDTGGYGGTHKIALFRDGTGRATTGSVVSQSAGPVADFIWTKIGPDAILISNCPTCAYQKLTHITGSLDEGLCLASFETIGGDVDTSSHAFVLTSGQL